jgi:hypothetical protein
VDAITRLLAPLGGLYLTGNYLYGVSVRDCLRHGLQLADAILARAGGAPSQAGVAPLNVESVANVSG